MARDGISVVIVLGLVALTAVFVGATLRVPDVPTHEPSPLAPEEVGTEVVGPRTVTVDASADDRWIYFDFSRGSVVTAPGALEWDLAFRRYRIITNGGPGFAGDGGAIRLSDASFGAVTTVPETGYMRTRTDSVNPALERWYDYSWTSHLLRPEPAVYAVRAADGRYAKLELLGYYCPGAQPGCPTIRYVYQGAGTTDVDVP